MDRKTTSTAGLASSRGTRLLREAAFGTAALAMALGLAAWVTDFDLATWVNPASANIGGTSSFDSSNDDAVRNQRDQDNTQQMINNQQSFDNQQRMNDEQASQNQQQMINAQ